MRMFKNENLKTLEWKGKTFNQITSKYIYNHPTETDSYSVSQLRKPNPLKIYRKEITFNPTSNCYARTSLKIRDFENPGMNVQNSIVQNSNGISNTIDMTYVNNTCEHPNQENCIKLLSPEENSLRKLRSNGMIKNKNYFTNSYNYLDSRTKTFQRNQSIHLTTGVSSVKPGSGLAINNVYKSNGPQKCAQEPVVYKPNNSKFAKQGSISSGDLILRKKIDAINTAAHSLSNTFGRQTANAEKYSSLGEKYTLKTKTGFNKKTCCRKEFSKTY